MYLHEIFQTRYFCDHWQKDLSYLINILTYEDVEIESKYLDRKVTELKAQKNPYITIDIAECRFCFSTMPLIHGDGAYNAGIRFIDSANPKRDAMLKEIYRRRELDYTVTPLDEINNIDEVPSYINSLSEDVIYSPLNLEKNVAIYLCVLITCIRPEVQIDMDKYLEPMFHYVRRFLYTSECEWDTVHILLGSTFYTQKVNEDGTIYVPSEGDMTWEAFKYSYIWLPGIFGTEHLNKYDDDNMWSKLLHSAIIDLSESLTPKETILNFLGGA